MEHYCEMLYCKLQKELGQCRNKKLAVEKEVECCFQASVKLWMELSEKLKNHCFETEEKEMEFFKMWKPKFTSVIEYYHLVYHALLFEPGDADMAILFWEREHERLEKFRADNRLFLQCYEDDQNEMGPYFFLRKYYCSGCTANTRIYETGDGISTNGDWFVAALLALQKYMGYVEKKMKVH